MNYSKWLPNSVIGAPSNKAYIKPSAPKGDPVMQYGIPAYGGYPFALFLGNVYALLDDGLAKLAGMQQLIHTYYLLNGSIGSRQTAQRIKHLLKGE